LLRRRSQRPTLYPYTTLFRSPGTGKTTFARALANTLQLKLLATSIGTWLEPSHLGDVLARMSAAFAEAEANAPCILFIDEIDGIDRKSTRLNSSHVKISYAAF